MHYSAGTAMAAVVAWEPRELCKGADFTKTRTSKPTNNTRWQCSDLDDQRALRIHQLALRLVQPLLGGRCRALRILPRPHLRLPAKRMQCTAFAHVQIAMEGTQHVPGSR